MTGGERWVADPRIGWRILLTARSSSGVDAGVVSERLEGLYLEQGWGAAPAVEVDEDAGRLLATLSGDRPAPVVIGASGSTLAISAHHSRVDGQGLLRVLASVTGSEVRAAARGAGDRPTTGGVTRTVARRLAEVAVRPPSRLDPPPRSGAGREHAGPDVLVEREVAGRFRTADVVHAATRAVVHHQHAQGRRSRRVAVAVGATRETPGTRGVGAIADRSVLLRLTGVERLDRDQVADALRTARIQTPPAVGGRIAPAADWLTRAGLRLLAPRLGSTLLVSHLGDVVARGVDRLAFHPVTGGGSGVSLGAVTLLPPTGEDEGHQTDGPARTVLTLRARADRWQDDGLERLLEAIAGRLP